MKTKRVTLFAGHYGSGKTNIAVNYALWLRSSGKETLICDLDIVNPYFRTKDSRKLFEEAGIKLIAGEFASSNVDLPALPQEIYGAVQNRSVYAVMDVGGDDRGALALGRYVPYILEENDYEMLFVANFSRPLTRTPEEALEVMREIEDAGGIAFTGIVNNTNLAEETTPGTVLKSVAKAKKLSALSGLPVKMTSVEKTHFGELKTKIENLFPMTLQEKYFQIKTKL
ncbi:MAG: hypothetical protein IJV00_06530 [Clostridia bacterium]|nr:hypothetical protein [Clostridia bacterium]